MPSILQSDDNLAVCLVVVLVDQCVTNLAEGMLRTDSGSEMMGMKKMSCMSSLSGNSNGNRSDGRHWESAGSGRNHWC